METKDFKHWLAINGVDYIEALDTIIVDDVIAVSITTNEVEYLGGLRVDLANPFCSKMTIINKVLEYAQTPVKER